ncbi:MAG: Fur family transcriptional regulator [Patescibacteria group bacterium]
MSARQAIIPDTSRGWRLTGQRLDILEYLRRNSGHPTAEQVYRGVKKKLRTIGFGTVYRNLDFLRRHGYIKECVVDKVTRYESRVDSHVHLVCEGCHLIFEIKDQRLGHIARSLAVKNDFFVRSDNLEIRGYCPECQKKISPKSKTPELFCMACGELLDDMHQEAPVCKDCCFQTNCHYYGPIPKKKK